jgi:cytidylate kinase
MFATLPKPASFAVNSCKCKDVFFLTADLAERARRRQSQLAQDGEEMDTEKIQTEIARRDASDQNRTVGPLTPADDDVEGK